MEPDAIAAALPRGFADSEGYAAFAAALSRATIEISQLHAIGACVCLAQALEAHPIAARMRLAKDPTNNRIAIAFETRLPDGEFIDARSAAYILLDFHRAKMSGSYAPDTVPAMAERIGGLLHGVIPRNMIRQADACKEALGAALAPLTTQNAMPYSIRAVAAGIPGAWIHRGASAPEIAILLGLPDIAAAIEAFELARSTGKASMASSRPASL